MSQSTETSETRDKIWIGVLIVMALFLDYTNNDMWAGFFGVYVLLAIINMNIKRLNK